jgi:oxygen-independent coproporphyrinogen-3 oxidase
MTVRAVYLHAPFCTRRCFYCDFAVQVRRHGDPDEWIDALRAELELRRADGVELASRLASVYVGGGTPSLLGPGAMDRVRDLLGPSRFDAEEFEWTAEANPESLTPEVAAAWRTSGLRRLSLGVQSFQAASLRWMGRLHGAEGAVRAVETARAAGFEEISVDLIFGLPDEVERDWRADLEQVLALDVPHVSLYGLTAEASTGLGRGVAAGRVRMPDEERYRDEYIEAHERLIAGGYVHYEVSNFARPGSESRHNTAYWNRSAYLGLGNGAHSFVERRRWWNEHDWTAYRDAVASGRDPTAEREQLDAAGDRLERIWTGLRTRAGLGLDTLAAVERDVVERWIGRGLAEAVDGRLRLTVEGWLLLDALAVELDGVELPTPSSG